METILKPFDNLDNLVVFDRGVFETTTLSELAVERHQNT